MVRQPGGRVPDPTGLGPESPGGVPVGAEAQADFYCLKHPRAAGTCRTRAAFTTSTGFHPQPRPGAAAGHQGPGGGSQTRSRGGMSMGCRCPEKPFSRRDAGRTRLRPCVGSSLWVSLPGPHPDSAPDPTTSGLTNKAHSLPALEPTWTGLGGRNPGEEGMQGLETGWLRCSPPGSSGVWDEPGPRLAMGAPGRGAPSMGRPCQDRTVPGTTRQKHFCQRLAVCFAAERSIESQRTCLV